MAVSLCHFSWYCRTPAVPTSIITGPQLTLVQYAEGQVRVGKDLRTSPPDFQYVLAIRLTYRTSRTLNNQGSYDSMGLAASWHQKGIICYLR